MWRVIVGTDTYLAACGLVLDAYNLSIEVIRLGEIPALVNISRIFGNAA